MKSKLVVIRGGTAEARESRLAQCRTWMMRRGWTLVDYSDELGSALFHRGAEPGAGDATDANAIEQVADAHATGAAADPQAGGQLLPRWHPARLLPPPGTLHPARLLALSGAGLLSRPGVSPLRWVVAGLAGIIAVGVYIALISSVQAPTGSENAEVAEIWLFVTATTLNVRTDPSAESQIVGVLYRDQRVLIGAEKFGWVQVIQPEKGYVSRRYLKAEPKP